MVKGGAVYIMTNKSHSTLYTGVTSDLLTRVEEHKTNLHPKAFTAKYNCHILVYYETFHSIEEGIGREKQIKGGSRAKKLALIETINPNWNDLYEEVKEW